MAMSIGIARYTRLLAVLLGFVVLLPVFEQAILADGVVRPDLFWIISRSLWLT